MKIFFQHVSLVQWYMCLFFSPNLRVDWCSMKHVHTDIYIQHWRNNLFATYPPKNKAHREIQLDHSFCNQYTAKIVISENDTNTKIKVGNLWILFCMKNCNTSINAFCIHLLRISNFSNIVNVDWDFLLSHVLHSDMITSSQKDRKNQK